MTAPSIVIKNKNMDFGKVSHVGGIILDLPPDDIRFANKPITRHNGDIKVLTGCPIWSHTAWQGKVYPKSTKVGQFLKYYAKCFSAIELNTTFYGLPNEITLERWKSEVPNDFKFCPKVPKLISHERQLSDVDEFIRTTCQTFAKFGQNFGCAFLQLPPKFEINGISRLKNFLSVWNAKLPLAVEFRHPSWFKNGALVEQAFDLLGQYSTATVISDVPGRRDVLHVSLTSQTLFVRFLGHKLHPSDLKRLEQWIHRLRYWLEKEIKEVYFFLHQPDDDLAPETVVLFVETLNHLCDLKLPVPVLSDWEDQHSFF